MEKRQQDDALMKSMPYLGRYSSLPDRHLLRKQKARSDAEKCMNLSPNSTLSCYEDGHDNNAVRSKKIEEENISDCTHSKRPDVVHGDVYPDQQTATQHYVILNNSVDGKDSGGLNPATDDSTMKTDSSHWRYASLPNSGFSLKNSAIFCDVCPAGTNGADRVSNVCRENDTCRDAGRDDKETVDDAFDRSAVDDFVMKMVPSFGKYASLPSKRLFQLKPSVSSVGSPEQTEKETVTCCIPENNFHGGNKVYDPRPSSYYLGQQNLEERLRSSSRQPRSSSCFDISGLFEPNPAWLSFKTFDDTIQEYATDSAYQTSDSLKLHTFSLSKEELQTKIEQFNLNPDGFKIEMETETDVYYGCIRVLIDLIRPVDIRTSSRPPSTFDLCQATETHDGTASFYLPRSYLATIRISSETTADQVIKDVLNKYSITNSSGRFALFEKINRKPDDGRWAEAPSTVYLRKLSNKERPLELCLHSIDETVDTFEERHFLLRENDKCEILWEAFALPELNRFLDILVQEEESYVEAIRKKYSSLRNVLEQKLDQERLQNYEFLVELQSPRSNSSFS